MPRRAVTEPEVTEEPDQAEQLDELVADDPEPGYPPPSLKDQLFGRGPRHTSRPRKPTTSKKTPADKPVTATVRKDVRGKVAMFLTMFGAGWSTRDEHCGQALLDAIGDQSTPAGTSPGIATALTDILCDSPDIVTWFTTGGSYMKWLTLATTLEPVLSMLFRHHVAHTVAEHDEGQAPADWGMYAAS